LTKNGTTGTLRKDSDGTVIDINDANFPANVVVDSRVCFELLISPDASNPTEVATNLKLFTSERVVNSPSGDLEVKQGEFLRVKGTTITGNIEVNGGSLIVEDSTVTGFIEGRNSSILGVQGSSTVNEYLESRDALSLLLSASTIVGNMEARRTAVGVTINGGSNIDKMEATSVSNISINGGTNIGKSLEVWGAGDVTITDNTIASNLEVTNVNGTCKICDNVVNGNTEVPPACVGNC